MLALAVAGRTHSGQFYNLLVCRYRSLASSDIIEAESSGRSGESAKNASGKTQPGLDWQKARASQRHRSAPSDAAESEGPADAKQFLATRRGDDSSHPGVDRSRTQIQKGRRKAGLS
jgi:hypothetical protein